MPEHHPDLRLQRFIPAFTIRPHTVRRFRSVFNLAQRSLVGRGVRVTTEMHEGVELYVYTPENAASDRGLLWIHGGGLVLGHPRQDHQRCGNFARALGVRVFSVNYRKAPEHPFPAAHDDCHRAWQYARSLGVEQIVVGGESAGGGLAAGLCQRLSDEGTPAAGQLLVYPMLDDRTSLDHELDALCHPMWNNESNRTGWSAFLGKRYGADTLPPYASPARRSKLQDQPPAHIVVGTLDLFQAECSDYHQRLTDAGVASTLHLVEGAIHGFLTVMPHAAVCKSEVDAHYAFIRRALELPA